MKKLLYILISLFIFISCKEEKKIDPIFTSVRELREVRPNIYSHPDYYMISSQRESYYISTDDFIRLRKGDSVKITPPDFIFYKVEIINK